MVTGSEIIPDSERLTRVTCWAWSWIERLRGRMPMPPRRAMAIAIRESVTVSMALDMSGMATDSYRVRPELVSTSHGMTSVSPGSSSTSSKVRPRAANGAGTSAGTLIHQFYGLARGRQDGPAAGAGTTGGEPDIGHVVKS